MLNCELFIVGLQANVFSIHNIQHKYFGIWQFNSPPFWQASLQVMPCDGLSWSVVLKYRPSMAKQRVEFLFSMAVVRKAGAVYSQHCLSNRTKTTWITWTTRSLDFICIPCFRLLPCVPGRLLWRICNPQSCLHRTGFAQGATLQKMECKWMVFLGFSFRLWVKWLVGPNDRILQEKHRRSSFRVLIIPVLGVLWKIRWYPLISFWICFQNLVLHRSSTPWWRHCLRL